MVPMPVLLPDQGGVVEGGRLQREAGEAEDVQDGEGGRGAGGGGAEIVEVGLRVEGEGPGEGAGSGDGLDGCGVRGLEGWGGRVLDPT